MADNKYLVIELDELGDVPRVFYKGKEITMKEFINFQWTTRNEVPGNTDIIVDYVKKVIMVYRLVNQSEKVYVHDQTGNSIM